MAFAFPLTPAPTSIERILETLPAQQQANLRWFPIEFRQAIVEPLRAASHETFKDVVMQVTYDVLPILMKLWEAGAALLESAPRMLEQADEARFYDEVQSRLPEPAAHYLCDAYAWLSAINQALYYDFRNQMATFRKLVPDSDKDLLDELKKELENDWFGAMGYWCRGIVLTTSAAEFVLSEDEPPAIMNELCRTAFAETHIAANMLRSFGLSIPLSVRSPSWVGSLPEPLGWFVPTGVAPTWVIDAIVERVSPEAIWLFGSRATGQNTHTSDWDFLVLVPDSTDMEDADALASQLRRVNVDLVFATQTQLDAQRSETGSLVQVALAQGVEVYRRPS